jgi:hypothetical protein
VIGRVPETTLRTHGIAERGQRGGGLSNQCTKKRGAGRYLSIQSFSLIPHVVAGIENSDFRFILKMYCFDAAAAAAAASSH